MRIAHIGLKGFPARFGADRAAEAVIRRLSERHEITVYCSSRHTSSDANIPRVRLVRIPSLAGKYTNMVSADLLGACHAVCRGDYELIHLHNIEASFVLPILKLRYPVVSTARGRHTIGNKWGRIALTIMRSMEVPYIFLSDIRTSVSQPDAKYFLNRFRKSVAWIPNGVGMAPEPDVESATKLLSSYHQPESGYILFAAGRIIPKKGAHVLLESFRKVRTDLRLIIVGDLSHLQRYAAELLTLADSRVTFITFESSLATLLGLVKRSRLFVFPSIYEGMSNMLLEAASIGTPVVCSDIPANTGVLPQRALFFSSENTLDLAAKLDWAINHPEEMRTLGFAARNWVLEKFSWTKIAEAYEQLYKDLNNRRQAAGRNCPETIYYA
ncbi:MAG TPA: glycosyltransferase family 4 protein [Verrucomicrobiota bacterium]|nr:glycosyltransferase family 4 protein [Verrucomicrobiota bacterium]